MRLKSPGLLEGEAGGAIFSLAVRPSTFYDCAGYLQPKLLVDDYKYLPEAQTPLLTLLYLFRVSTKRILGIFYEHQNPYHVIPRPPVFHFEQF